MAKQVKNQEEMFTMADAVAEIKKNELAKQEHQQQRLQEFVKGFDELQKRTGCGFKIDMNSPLSNIQVVPTVLR